MGEIEAVLTVAAAVLGVVMLAVMAALPLLELLEHLAERRHAAGVRRGAARPVELPRPRMPRSTASTASAC